MSERRGPPPGLAEEQKRPPESDDAHQPPHQEGGPLNEEHGPNKLSLALEVFLSGNGGWVGLLDPARHLYGVQIQPKPSAGLGPAATRHGNSGALIAMMA